MVDNQNDEYIIMSNYATTVKPHPIIDWRIREHKSLYVWQLNIDRKEPNQPRNRR